MITMRAHESNRPGTAAPQTRADVGQTSATSATCALVLNPPTQLFIGLHLIHEVTSPQAFDMLRERGLKVKYPQRTIATVDHIVPTDVQLRPVADDLAEALTTASRLILTAPTGSGKSTQVPQMLLDRGLLGEGEVVILQPRRLAARLLAARVAEERGVPLGTEVGYQVRFDKQVSEATSILYVTEGILLRRLLTSPNLDTVSAILFDEFPGQFSDGAKLTIAKAKPKLLKENGLDVFEPDAVKESVQAIYNPA